MYFCKGQEDFGDAQCCLFVDVRGADEQYPNLSREELNGLSKFKAIKNHEENYQKENKLVNKNTRPQKSQQKSKFSLSKLSGKKGNSTQQNIQQKDISISKSNSQYTTTQKSKPVEEHPTNISITPIQHPSNFQINKNFSYNPITKQTLQQYIISNNVYPTSSSMNNISKANIFIKDIPTLQANVSSIPFIRINEIKQETMDKKQQSQMYFPTSLHPEHLKYMFHRFTKHEYHQHSQPQLIEQDANFRKPQQIHQINIIQMEQTKGVPTTTTSIPTDRMMIQSNTESTGQNGSLAQQNLKIFESMYKLPQNQIIESRLTDTLIPEYGGQHLRTVNSVYNSSIGGKKQVQESVILINFFNPTQNQKKEFSQKLIERSLQQYIS